MGKDDVLRFYGCHSDRRSSEWSLVVGGRSGDEVYLSTRSELGDLKVSLHASGYSQHGFTQRMRDEMPPGHRGALDKWRRKQGLPGEPVIAYRVIFPGRSMVQDIRDRHHESVPLPLADLTQELVLDFVFTEPPVRGTEAEFPDGPLVATCILGRGTELSIRMHSRHTDPAFEVNVSQLVSSLPETHLPRPLYTSGVGYAFGWDPRHGVRCATEVLVRN